MDCSLALLMLRRRRGVVVQATEPEGNPFDDVSRSSVDRIETRLEWTMQSGRIPSRRGAIRFAVAVLAVGGLSSLPTVTGGAAAASTHKVKHLVVSTAQNSTYGTILVSGKTVYTLKASKVACTAKCLKVWPELLLPKGVTKPTAGAGVSASNLGTVKRRGHRLQVTYSRRPLYWFVDDTPGQVNGNITDTWGKWSVVVLAKPAGPSPLPASSVSPGTSTPPTSHTSTTSGNPNGSQSPKSNAPAAPAPTTPPPTTMPPPPTTPPTAPPPTTTPPTAPPPTTTTTAPGGGGVAF
jgi:predicted lipoprotein with Yx(FWY)xxD motif